MGMCSICYINYSRKLPKVFISLTRRTIIEDPMCDRCGACLETIIHALWSCLETDVVWLNSDLWSFRETT